MALGNLTPQEVATEQIMAVIESSMEHQLSSLPPHMQVIARPFRTRVLYEIRERMPEILQFLNIRPERKYPHE